MKLLADLHVHSRASVDGRSSVQALIEAARARGLAAITVSDHDLCTPLLERPDVLLIPGVEITSANGHILGLFLDRPIDFAALGRYPAPEKAIEAIHACGGLAVLAHPFAPVKLSEDEISKLPFDAVETANARAMLKPGANESPAVGCRTAPSRNRRLGRALRQGTRRLRDGIYLRTEPFCTESRTSGRTL